MNGFERLPAQMKVECLKGLVQTMVCCLVDEPKWATVNCRASERYVYLDVRVVPADLGKLIGRQGRTAQSVRTVVYGAARKLGLRCEINFNKTGETAAETEEAR